MCDFSDKFSNLVLVFGPDSVVMSDIESKLASLTTEYDMFPAGVFHLGKTDSSNAKGYSRTDNDKLVLSKAVLIDAEPHPQAPIPSSAIAEFIKECTGRKTNFVWIGCEIVGLPQGIENNTSVKIAANMESVLTFLRSIGYKG